MLNRWTGMGRIASDLELKTTQSGTPVLQFSIAIDRDYKSQEGEKLTDFIQIVAWKKTAEMISRYFAKGNMICVEGAINTRSYNAQDGSKRYVTEIVADRVHFTGEKANAPTAASNAPTAGQTTPQYEVIEDDSDLPF